MRRPDLGGLLPPSSRLADRGGRRRTLWLGIGLFVLSRWPSALAADVGTLLAARLAQEPPRSPSELTVLALIGDVHAGLQRVRGPGALTPLPWAWALCSADWSVGLLYPFLPGWLGLLGVISWLTCRWGWPPSLAAPRLFSYPRVTTPPPDVVETGPVTRWPQRPWCCPWSRVRR